MTVFAGFGGLGMTRFMCMGPIFCRGRSGKCCMIISSTRGLRCPRSCQRGTGSGIVLTIASMHQRTYYILYHYKKTRVCIDFSSHYFIQQAIVSYSVKLVEISLDLHLNRCVSNLAPYTLVKYNNTPVIKVSKHLIFQFLLLPNCSRANRCHFLPRA